MIRKAMITAAIGAMTIATTTACNTVEGAGEDLESASNEVEEEI